MPERVRGKLYLWSCSVFFGTLRDIYFIGHFLVKWLELFLVFFFFNFDANIIHDKYLDQISYST